MALRAIVVSWIAVAMVGAYALSAEWFDFGGAQIPDAFHILAHFLLVGGLAFIVARIQWEPPEFALAVAVGAGLSMEIVQAVIGRFRPHEMVFDMSVNTIAAMLGLVLGGQLDMPRRLGFWLHPLVVVPLGLVGLYELLLGSLGRASFWVGVLLASFAPAVLFWLGGVALGWFDDLDLRERSHRPKLFLVATACAGLYAVIVHNWGPPALSGIALGLVVASLLITGITVAGFKISGHVSGSVLLAITALPYTPRGAFVLVVAGGLVSWARIRDRCHTPFEVAGAWVLAGVLLLSSQGL